jgi:DnaK suppressor protein
MTKAALDRFRKQLLELGRRVSGSTKDLESEALRSTGGESAGGISNTPMHLADAGADAADQELNATLLENEAFLGDEIAAAVARIDAGKFGVCEECSEAIPAERLEILPYARYCVPCTEKLHAGGAANMNDGRPAAWASSFEQSEGKRQGSAADAAIDSHAAGTPGGGSALGGLAGTNLDGGDPDGEQLENAMASGSFDVADEADEPKANDAYSGPSGGAIGGSPANKRSTGGRGPR